MNNLSFWLLIPAAIMIVGSFFMPGGAPGGLDALCAADAADGPVDGRRHLLLHPRAKLDHGLIHIIITILNMRAGDDADEDALFRWTWLITAIS